MKIDVTQELKSFDGTALKMGDEPLTLRLAATEEG